MFNNIVALDSSRVKVQNYARSEHQPIFTEHGNCQRVSLCNQTPQSQVCNGRYRSPVLSISSDCQVAHTNAPRDHHWPWQSRSVVPVLKGTICVTMHEERKPIVQKLGDNKLTSTRLLTKHVSSLLWVIKLTYSWWTPMNQNRIEYLFRISRRLVATSGDGASNAVEMKIEPDPLNLLTRKLVFFNISWRKWPRDSIYWKLRPDIYSIRTTLQGRGLNENGIISKQDYAQVHFCKQRNCQYLCLKYNFI